MYVFLNITTKSDKRSGFPRKYLYKTWVKREFPFVYGLCRTEDKNEEDISTLYQTIQFLSGIVPW